MAIDMDLTLIRTGYRLTVSKGGIMHKDLGYFMGLNYSIRIRRRGKFFTLFIPELSLVEEDESLATAYEKLESEKERYFQQMIEVDSGGEIVLPRDQLSGQGFFQDIVPFLTKLAIALSLIMMLGYMANNKVNRVMYDITRYLGQPHSYVITNLKKYEKASKERRQEIRAEFRDTLILVKPFLREIKAFLEEPYETE